MLNTKWRREGTTHAVMRIMAAWHRRHELAIGWLGVAYIVAIAIIYAL